MKYEIRRAKREEWEDAMALAWRTFQKYEAPEYTKEGVSNFLNFISDQSLYKMFINGDYKLYVAVKDEVIIGIIALRKKTHISLLFVDDKYHKHGVGRALIMYAIDQIMENEHMIYATVNAAPYAVEFYHKVGFKDMGKQTIADGITYTPMSWGRF